MTSAKTRQYPAVDAGADDLNILVTVWFGADQL